MISWLFGGKKRVERLEEETKKSFDSVKNDFEGVGKWLKHHHGRHEDDPRSTRAFPVARDLSLERAHPAAGHGAGAGGAAVAGQRKRPDPGAVLGAAVSGPQWPGAGV